MFSEPKYYCRQQNKKKTGVEKNTRNKTIEMKKKIPGNCKRYPIVYTTRLDEMKIFKESKCGGMSFKEMVQHVTKESKPKFTGWHRPPELLNKYYQFLNLKEYIKYFKMKARLKTYSQTKHLNSNKHVNNNKLFGISKESNYQTNDQELPSSSLCLNPNKHSNNNELLVNSKESNYQTNDQELPSSSLCLNPSKHSNNNELLVNSKESNYQTNDQQLLYLYPSKYVNNNKLPVNTKKSKYQTNKNQKRPSSFRKNKTTYYIKTPINHKNSDEHINNNKWLVYEKVPKHQTNDQQSSSNKNVKTYRIMPINNQNTDECVNNNELLVNAKRSHNETNDQQLLLLSTNNIKTYSKMSTNNQSTDECVKNNESLVNGKVTQNETNDEQLLPLSTNILLNYMKRRTKKIGKINNLINDTDLDLTGYVHNWTCKYNYEFGNNLVVFDNIYANEFDIYHIDKKGDVLGYYRMSNDNDPENIHSFIGNLKKIASENCCWYRRETIIKIIQSQCLLASDKTTRFFRKPHSCLPDRCQCCCNYCNLNLNLSSMTNLTASISSSYKKITMLTTEKDATSKTQCCRDLFKKACKIHPFNLFHCIQRPEEGRHVSEDLNQKSNIKTNVVIIRNPVTNEIEIYEFNLEGKIVSHIKEKYDEITYRDSFDKYIGTKHKHVLWDIKKESSEYIYVCCWFKRESVIEKLIKMEILHIESVKFIRQRHTCPIGFCGCCCLPLTCVREKELERIDMCIDKYTVPLNLSVPASYLRVNKNKSNKKLTVNKKVPNKHQSSSCPVHGTQINHPNSPATTSNKKITKPTSSQQICNEKINKLATKESNPDFNKFQGMKLIINKKGAVEAALKVPVHTLTPSELKILVEILSKAQNQIKTLTSTPIDLENTISEISNDVTMTPTITNVFSLKNSVMKTSTLDPITDLQILSSDKSPFAEVPINTNIKETFIFNYDAVNEYVTQVNTLKRKLPVNLPPLNLDSKLRVISAKEGGCLINKLLSNDEILPETRSHILPVFSLSDKLSPGNDITDTSHHLATIDERITNEETTLLPMQLNMSEIDKSKPHISKTIKTEMDGNGDISEMQTAPDVNIEGISKELSYLKAIKQENDELTIEEECILGM